MSAYKCLLTQEAPDRVESFVCGENLVSELEPAINTTTMWTEGLVKIVGDRDNTEGKYVVAATDIGPGLLL